MKELEEIPAYLPNGAALKDAVQKAKDWLQEVEALQVREPGCWVGTVTLLMSPEPSQTPSALQGSVVALTRSTQSKTLVTSAMEYLHSLPASCFCFWPVFLHLCNKLPAIKAIKQLLAKIKVKKLLHCGTSP